MNRRSPMRALLAPAAMSRTTSFSRAVRPLTAPAPRPRALELDRRIEIRERPRSPPHFVHRVVCPSQTGERGRQIDARAGGFEGRTGFLKQVDRVLEIPPRRLVVTSRELDDTAGGEVRGLHC